jgi:hypothetical protein
MIPKLAITGRQNSKKSNSVLSIGSILSGMCEIDWSRGVFVTAITKLKN